MEFQHFVYSFISAIALDLLNPLGGISSFKTFSMRK